MRRKDGSWRRGCRLRVLLFTATAGLWSFPARAAEAPVTRVDRVLVYSTEAQVVHRSQVNLGKGEGAQEVELVSLPGGALQDSVRVRCKTAKVQHVEVIQAAGKLPQQIKAEALLTKIESLVDQLQDLADEQRVLQDELAYMDSLALPERPQPSERRGWQPPPGLFAKAFGRILNWLEQRSERIRGRLRALAAERRERDRALHDLRVEAKDLLPSATGQAVPRVVAHLRGRAGRHQVEVSYRATAVRWVPSYDLRYEPRTRTVEATYYANVNQTTGEDWDQARLRFSTALPTQLLAVPELATLTLGRKRDFVPRPPERVEPGPARWRAQPVPQPADPTLELLRQAVEGRTELDVTGEMKPAEGRAVPDVDRDGVPDMEDRMKAKKESLARSRYPYRPAPSQPRMEVAEQAAPAMAPPEPEAARPMALADAAPAARSSSIFGGSRSYTPRETLPWSEAGYRPPTLHPDLPAAAAEGYRFTLYAPGRHSVGTSGREQRIPLMRQRLRVRPVYRIVPGKSKQAYLLAEVDNTTGKPILRGHANLFAGAMFTGRSWINTALPGKTITLPLGVDDAVKVERHIRQETEAEGVVFKDDVSRYTVQIEIANHHRYPIQVMVEDQVPVKSGDKVEIGGWSSSPTMTKPDRQGRVTWEGTVKGSSVKKLIFKFNIVRPKDWELRQYNG